MNALIIGLAVFILTMAILIILIFLIAFKHIFLKEENLEQYRDELQRLNQENQSG